MRSLVLAVVLGWAATGLAAERVVDTDLQNRVLRIRELREGLPVWELGFDPTGLPQREVFFRDGLPLEQSTLVYQGLRLVERRVSDGEGRPLYVDRLGWWPDGTLRRLDRQGGEGRVTWSYRDGRLVSTWTEGLDGPGAHREWSTGAVTREALFRDGGLVVERLLEWSPEASKETRREPGEDRSVVRRLDSQGRVLEQTVTVAGQEVSRSQWTYEGERTATVSTQSAAGLEVWSYRHEGALTYGTLTRDGLVVQEETLDDGVLVENRFYDRGSLVLVETWSQGKKVRESYYWKGELVRERNP